MVPALSSSLMLNVVWNSLTHGPSPRVIINILTNLDWESPYRQAVENGATTIARNSEAVLLAIQMLNFGSDMSSKIFHVKAGPDRQLPALWIPTPFLMSTLAVALSGRVTADQHGLFTTFSGHPSLRSVGGWIFDGFAHVRFSDPKAIPMQGYLPDDPNPHVIPTVDGMITGSSALSSIRQPFNFYWRPREANFQGIDALIRVDNIVWALQFCYEPARLSPGNFGPTYSRPV
jgi:hypothetical protein